MKKQLYIYLLLLGFCSCKTNRPVTPDNILQVNIDKISENSPDIDSLLYIPHYTSDESLIKNINKILYQNGIFYIFDRSQKKVFLFNEEGDILKTIHHVGNGPGEYVLPWDMDVDKEGNLYILDNGTKSVLKYTGSDIERWKK